MIRYEHTVTSNAAAQKRAFEFQALGMEPAALDVQEIDPMVPWLRFVVRLKWGRSGAFLGLTC